MTDCTRMNKAQMLSDDFLFCLFVVHKFFFYGGGSVLLQCLTFSLWFAAMVLAFNVLHSNSNLSLHDKNRENCEAGGIH